MCGFFLQVAESGNLSPIQDDQSLFEVEVSEVRDQSYLFSVLFAELLNMSKFEILHFGDPNGVQRYEKDIFAPLFDNLELYLTERLEL
jgi:hypothetical protein